MNAVRINGMPGVRGSNLLTSTRDPGQLSLRAGTITFMKFTVAVTHEGDLFVAKCLDVDVVSQGTNFEEAVANLEEALALYFEDEKLPESLEPPVITTVLLPA